MDVDFCPIASFLLLLSIFLLGHYAFVHFGPKMDRATEKKEATYNANPLTLTTPHCVAFFYRNHQIRNTPKVMLSLLLVFPSAPQAKDTIVWESNVDHGKKWMAVKRTVSTKERFVLTVRFLVPPEKHSSFHFFSRYDSLERPISDCNVFLMAEILVCFVVQSQWSAESTRRHRVGRYWWVRSDSFIHSWII